MRILVTGAAGFIGLHLVRELAAHKHEVIVTDKEPLDDAAEYAISGFRWDIRDEHEIDGFVESLAVHEEAPPDAVIHLAAIAAPRKAAAEPQLAWDTNVRGTHNVLKLAKKAEIRKVLFFSSAHVYGISPKYLPTDESAPMALHDTYTVTKIIGEDLCWRYWEDCNIAPVIFRLWNAYGPGQNPDYFLGAKLAEAVVLARAREMPDGLRLKREAEAPLLIKGADITKDFVHVSDVVRAARLAVESSYVGELNVGTGVETPLGDLGAQLARGFGLRMHALPSDDPGPTRMRCDPTRIRQVLGWTPKVKVADGLAELIASAKAKAEGL